MTDKEQDLERDEIGIAIEERRASYFYRYERENYKDWDMVKPLITHKHNLRLVTENWADEASGLATSSEATVKGGDGGEVYLMSTTDNRLVLAEARDVFPVNELNEEGMAWDPTFRAIIDKTLLWLEGRCEVAELYNLALELEKNLERTE